MQNTSFNQYSLLVQKRFSPLFFTQFLGAFHDNIFKNAFVVLLLYGIAGQDIDNPELLVTLATAIFILPFIFFSAYGGILADTMDKAILIRRVKITEIGIALFGCASLFTASIPLSFVTLILLGIQSSFFGPSKFSILPQHLKPHELIGGNAFLNTGSFLAILFGTLLGTTLILIPFGEFLVSGLIIGSAIIGYLSSLHIPSALPSFSKALSVKEYVFLPFSVLKNSYTQNISITYVLLGIGWFYFMGGMFLAQMPNFVSGVLHANEIVLAIFLVLFSIGIAIGGLLNNKLLGSMISTRLAPYVLFGISVFTLDLYFASAALTINTYGPLSTLGQFLDDPQSWRVMIDTILIAICGGLFVVPLNAYLQHHTDNAVRARRIAANAITNALFIVVSSGAAALLLINAFTIDQIFLFFAFFNLAVVVKARVFRTI